MITIGGQTFNYRDHLKAIGARWNPNARNWECTYLTDDEYYKLVAFGLTISGYQPLPEYEPEEIYTPKETIILGDDQTWLGKFGSTDPIAYCGFGDLQSFVDYVEQLPRPCGPGTDDYRWLEIDEAAKTAQAIAIARAGWSDGLGLMQQLTTDTPTGKRLKPSVAGGRVNVGRMLSGDPLHMKKRRKAPGNRFIRLFVDSTIYVGGSNPNRIMKTLLVSAMIDLLEKNDYRCEIYSIGTMLRLNDRLPAFHHCIKLKSFSERLNLIDISFALGHPYFGQDLLGPITESLPLYTERERSGYYDSDIQNMILDDNEFYVPPLFPHQELTLKNDPFSMLKFIEPDGLPITIRKD